MRAPLLTCAGAGAQGCRLWSAVFAFNAALRIAIMTLVDDKLRQIPDQYPPFVDRGVDRRSRCQSSIEVSIVHRELTRVDGVRCSRSLTTWQRHQDDPRLSMVTDGYTIERDTLTMDRPHTPLQYIHSKLPKMAGVHEHFHIIIRQLLPP